MGEASRKPNGNIVLGVSLLVLALVLGVVLVGMLGREPPRPEPAPAVAAAPMPAVAAPEATAAQDRRLGNPSGGYPATQDGGAMPTPRAPEAPPMTGSGEGGQEDTTGVFLGGVDGEAN